MNNLAIFDLKTNEILGEIKNTEPQRNINSTCDASSRKNIE